MLRHLTSALDNFPVGSVKKEHDAPSPPGSSDSGFTRVSPLARGHHHLLPDLLSLPTHHHLQQQQQDGSDYELEEEDDIADMDNETDQVGLSL